MFRQGTTAALGADSTLKVLVSPEIDTFRYPNLWNTDLRAARTFKVNNVTSARHHRRVQRVQREHGAGAEQQRASPTFNPIAQNLSPRIFRVRIGGRILMADRQSRI